MFFAFNYQNAIMKTKQRILPLKLFRKLLTKSIIRKRRTDTVSINKKESEAYKIFDETPSAEDQLIIEQNLAQLLNYIKQLKPHYQEIINLRYFREMSYKEMADYLNEPMSNIKVKLVRAKKLLAAIIEKSS